MAASGSQQQRGFNGAVVKLFWVHQQVASVTVAEGIGEVGPKFGDVGAATGRDESRGGN